MTEVSYHNAGEESPHNAAALCLSVGEAQQRCRCILVSKGDLLFLTQFLMDQRCIYGPLTAVK